MSFLNPYMLFALFLISVPVLIHLFNLTKVNKMDFSTLMFLKEVQKSKLKKLKLKQLLLMFFRILFLGFLILGFSNPVFKGCSTGDNTITKKCIIFIDDSFSMETGNQGYNCFESARKEAKKILEMYRDVDKLYVIPFSDVGLRDKLYESKDINDAVEKIENIKISYKTTLIKDLLNTAKNIISNNYAYINEIYIISDFQKSIFDYNSATLQNEIDINNCECKLYLINVSSVESPNISIRDIIIKSKILNSSGNIKLDALVTNHNPFNVYNKSLNLYVSNQKIDEKLIDIVSGETVNNEFQIKSTGGEDLSGYVELIQNDINDDGIRKDNRFYFSVIFPGNINIGIIDNIKNSSGYLNLAINSALSIGESQNKKNIIINNVSEINDDLDKYDMLFITGYRKFTEKQTDIIFNYLKKGRGIFFFPDNSADFDNINNLFLKKITSLKIKNKNYVSDSVNSGLIFKNIDFEHPVIYGIFKDNKFNINTDISDKIESPVIRSYYEILTGDKSSEIIKLNNLHPFLAESNLYDFKFLFCSVSANDDMSNFPTNSIFAPVIINSIYYLSGFSYEAKNYTVGKNIIIKLKGDFDNLEVITPEEKLLNIYSNKSGIEKFIEIQYNSDFKEPGIYNIKSNNKTFSFSLNHDYRESYTTLNDEGNIKKYFEFIKGMEITYLKNTEEIKTIVSTDRKGIDLTRYFLIASIIFLIAEIYYSRKLLLK